MADEKDNGGKPGDDSNATEDKSGKAGDKAGKKDANGGDNSDENSNKPKPVTFESQEALDAIIEKRLQRERDKMEADAKLSKEQKLEKERDEALKLANESKVKDAFILKSNLPYDKALRIYRIYKEEIETDKSGKPTNLDEILKTARTEYGELFPPKVKGKGDGGGGEGKSSAGASIDNWLREK